MKNLIFFVLLALLTKTAQNAKILLVNPMPAYSHFIIPFKLAEELANRGHHVTAITSYPQKTKIKNYVDIPVVENIPLIDEMKKTLFDQNTAGLFGSLTSLFDMSAIVTNATIHHKNVQKLLASKEHFDVVIIENFINEAFLGFGNRYDAPVVLVFSQGSNGMNNFLFGNPAPASYIPSAGGNLTKKMNFWQRLQNLFSNAVFDAFRHFYHLPQQKAIFESYVKDVAFEYAIYNASLMLTNSHVSFSPAVPHLPSIIPVGGFYVTTKPLPDDLQKFLDDAKEGVVLFSMGSNLKSQDLKPEVRDGILRAFAKIKQKVLWKFETDLPNSPANVKISHWLPQADILNHPNVRVFITHGGRLSTVEAIKFGVPIIGIPVFGDQPSNIAAAVDDGYAVRVNLDELSEETLSWALKEILENPKYRANAQKRSKILRDQPVAPMDAAVFWVEHVIRYGGAHLRSAALDLKWYQRDMLDLYAFIFTLIGTVLYIGYRVVKKVCCVLGRKKVVKKVKRH